MAGSLPEIFTTFLRLGLTAFGGPIAHLGYFREELVERRRWISESGYADLIALCQFLPGPASSQVGFGLGLIRGGLPGALTAWFAFTLPSALLLLAFAMGASLFQGPVGEAVIHGLKLVAVAVVAQAVWGMAHKLCPDRQRAAIALGALLALAFLPTTGGQIGVIILGGMAGLVLCRHLPQAQTDSLEIPVPRILARLSLVGFFGLLAGLPLLVAWNGSPELALFEALYRAGALVFGGGHVVLPLLEGSMVDSGRMSADTFLAGYGMAQAIPGPLFTFSAYLGASVGIEPGPLAGAVIALVAVFLPGMLILLATLPFWAMLRERAGARAVMAGTNAAVVGILASALYDPVWTSAVQGPVDFAVAAAAFVLLSVWKMAPWQVVLLTATLGGALTAL